MSKDELDRIKKLAARLHNVTMRELKIKPTASGFAMIGEDDAIVMVSGFALLIGFELSTTDDQQFVTIMEKLCDLATSARADILKSLPDGRAN